MEESKSSKIPRLAPSKGRKKRRLNILEDKLEALYEYHLEPKEPSIEMTPEGKESLEAWQAEYNSNFLEEDLEFLYDKLIRPFAAQLERIQENPHHKLILAPTKVRKILNS